MSSVSLSAILFQSTPSVGRATIQKIRTTTDSSISIHALRGEGDGWSYDDSTVDVNISIHALRGEGDDYSPPL